jgi:hypothetical protein
MESVNNEIHEYDMIVDNIVLADGLTRTGKALLNNLLLGLDKLSSIQFFHIVEQLLPMYINNHMSKNAISAYIRLYLNENFYNYKLSRNMNFRFDDLTSIYNTSTHKEFHKNLNKKDGDHIVTELLNDKIYFQYQTHDLMTHYSYFLDLNINTYILELFRNPIDTVYSWYKRGWGERFDNKDPRSGTTLFKYKGYIIPHYVIGHEEEYLSLNSLEKCVFMHNILLNKSISEYKKLTPTQKDKILLLKYEDLLLNTENEITKICTFLDTTTTSFINKVMQDANVPRKIDINERVQKQNEIYNNINSSLQKDLAELVEYYETQFYELNEQA